MKKSTLAYSVYHLFASDDPDSVRYVGISSNPEARLRQHVRNKGREGKAKSEWVARVVSRGASVFMSVIAGGLTADEACRLEKDEYSRLIASGASLVNGNSGGGSGYVPTKEVRYRLAEMSRGRRHSPETIEKMRRNCGNREVTDETRIKLSIAGKGRIVSDETRKRISESNKGRIQHENTILANRARRGSVTSEAAKQAKIAAAAMSGPRNGKNYAGVSRSGRSFNARIQTSGIGIICLSRDTEEKAAMARDRVMFCYWGEGRCYLNIPDNLEFYRSDLKCIEDIVKDEESLRREDSRISGRAASTGRKRKYHNIA